MKVAFTPAAFGLSFVPNTASAGALTSEGYVIKGFRKLVPL